MVDAIIRPRTARAGSRTPCSLVEVGRGSSSTVGDDPAPPTVAFYDLEIALTEDTPSISTSTTARGVPLAGLALALAIVS